MRRGADQALAEVTPLVDLVLVFGASAIADRADVIPAALEAARGAVEHLGMPVDPGNLLMVGALGDVPVLGAPGARGRRRRTASTGCSSGCSRGCPSRATTSPAWASEGFSWKSSRVPQPREEPAAAAGTPRIAALVLAAGRSTRMGGPNKLLATIDGVPLVRHAAEAALGAGLAEVVVVTGHQGEAVRGALTGSAAVSSPTRISRRGSRPPSRRGCRRCPTTSTQCRPARRHAARLLRARCAPRAAYAPAAGAAYRRACAGRAPWQSGAVGAALFRRAHARHRRPGRPRRPEPARRGCGRGPAEADDVHLDLDTPEALAAAGGRIGP